MVLAGRAALRADLWPDGKRQGCLEQEGNETTRPVDPERDLSAAPP